MVAGSITAQTAVQPEDAVTDQHTYKRNGDIETHFKYQTLIHACSSKSQESLAPHNELSAVANCTCTHLRSCICLAIFSGFS